MKPNYGFVFFAALLFSYNCFAQTEDVVSDESANRIKLNLTALPLKNYSLQYERVISRRGAAAISFRSMPMGKIPFQSQIKKLAAEEDASLENTIDKLRVGNFAITPEYRFYFGKGTAKGFYIAPFYRYAKFKASNVLITYTDDVTNSEETVNLSGDLTSHTGGILFGAQWNLSKRFVLDWMIVGPHVGSGNGSFIGVSSRTLTPSEQEDIRQELEELDIPLTRKTVNVNAQGASLLLDGPWGGIRSGLSIGFIF